MREGQTSRLLAAGVGGTFMKAFGTAFTTATGLASCHTTGAQPVGGGVFLLGPAAAPTSGAAYGALAAAG